MLHSLNSFHSSLYGKQQKEKKSRELSSESGKGQPSEGQEHVKHFQNLSTMTNINRQVTEYKNICLSKQDNMHKDM
jgi:hypothetical protein